MGDEGSTLYGHQKPAGLISSHSTQSMISMDGGGGALRNNGHPSRGHNGRLNGARAGGGILRNVQAHFPRSQSAEVAAAVGVTRPQ